MVGLCGFRLLILVNYGFRALALVATIGYKFSIILAPLPVVESWSESQVVLSIPPDKGLDEVGANPLLVGNPGGIDNQAFFHLGRDDLMEGPEQILIVSMSHCSSIYSDLDQGILVAREVVIVGERYKPASTFYMSEDHT